MKIRLIILSMALAIFLSGCTQPKSPESSVPAAASSKVPEQTASTAVQVTPVPTEAVATEEPKEKDNQVLQKISREEAGLTGLPIIKLDPGLLNSELLARLKDGQKDYDSDYAKGILYSNGLVISERYKDTIFDTIKIGTPLTDVKSLLGEPSEVEDDMLLYRTEEYYICFKGNSAVEQAAVTTDKRYAYPPNILKKILEFYDSPNLEDNLIDFLESSKEFSDFFDARGFVHGGGWYFESYNGIFINTLSGNEVQIYNNFEGDLYSLNASGSQDPMTIEYVNEDYIAQDLYMDLRGYIFDNEQFDQEGVSSPNGKLKFIHEWINSMNQHFTIRTLDHSKADYQIHATATDYRWLNDDYILYTHAWAEIPLLCSVHFVDGNYETINILYQADVLENEDYIDYVGSDGYELAEMTNDTMRFIDNKTQEVIEVKYTMEDGKIKVAKVR